MDECEEPGARLRALRVVGTGAAPGLEEGFLDGVLCQGRILEDSEGEAVGDLAEAVVELAERARSIVTPTVAFPGTGRVSSTARQSLPPRNRPAGDGVSPVITQASYVLSLGAFARPQITIAARPSSATRSDPSAPISGLVLALAPNS